MRTKTEYALAMGAFDGLVVVDVVVVVVVDTRAPLETPIDPKLKEVVKSGCVVQFPVPLGEVAMVIGVTTLLAPTIHSRSDSL